MSSAFNIPAGWEHLKQYGYAPGNYMNKCHTCGKVVEFVDKRAITCRPCAEARHAAAPPVDAVPGEPVTVSRHEINTHANALRGYIDSLSGDTFHGAIHALGALRDIIDSLAASVASRAGSEPVMWQSRFFDSTSSVTPGWGKWEEVVPRNAYTDTVEDRVQELRHYIAAGYKYELRALYTIAPAAAAEPTMDALPKHGS